MPKSLVYFLIASTLYGCGGGSNSVNLTTVENGWEAVQMRIQSSIAVATGMLTIVTSQSE